MPAGSAAASSTRGSSASACCKARMLFAMEFNPLTHGVIWSLLANVTAYVAGSLMRQPTPIERVQATSFVARDIQPGSGTGFKLWRTAVTADRLEDTVARYIGADRARAAFEGFRAQQGQIGTPGARGGEADVRLIRFAEHLLASAVGVASARLVIALMLERHSTPCARRHAAARRCLGRDPAQPRPAAIGHRQRGPGACGVRARHDADLLEQHAAEVPGAGQRPQPRGNPDHRGARSLPRRAPRAARRRSTTGCARSRSRTRCSASAAWTRARSSSSAPAPCRTAAWW